MVRGGRPPEAPDPLPRPVEGSPGRGLEGERPRRQPQAGRRRLLQHPGEGDVGEIPLRVAAADVGVRPGEPHLLDRLVIGLDALVPGEHRKLAALLVDRHRVVGVGDVGIELGVEELLAQEPAQRGDGVPDADEIGLALAAVGRLELLRHLVVAALAVELDRVGDQVLAALLQEAALVEQPGERPGGEGTATEPEEEDPVSRLVAVHQIGVGVRQVLAQAHPEGLTEEGAKALAEGNPEEVEGTDARVVEGELPPIPLDGLEQVDHVGVVAAVLLAGAVAADDDVLAARLAVSRFRCVLHHGSLAVVGGRTETGPGWGHLPID